MIGYRLSLAEKLFKAYLINVAVAALFFYFVQYYYFIITPKIILIFYAVLSYFLLFGWRVLSLSFIHGAAGKGAFYFIGPHPELEEISRAFEHNPYYSNFKVLAGKSSAEIKSESDVDFSLLEERAKSGLFSAIVATLPHQHNENLIRKFYDSIFNGVHFFDFQKFYESVFHKIPVSLVNEMWFLENVSSPSLAVYDFLKRIVDIVVSAASGAVFLLFYPFIIAAIKLDDGGPIFITQERIGRYQKPIRIVKFRSMSGNDQGEYGKGGKTKLKVTRVGRWVRLLRVDELPQLWNVLRGDLSLVGPRPELPALAGQYSSRIPYYNARHLIPPGLTGWAQIRHDQHPHHGADITETKEKLSYDLYYLRHRSLLLDLFIILQTVKIVITARGS